MVEKRRTSPKPLTRRGFLNSQAVARAKETWGYSKSHANILAKILGNWQSPNPASTASFGVIHLRYREEIASLSGSQIIKIDGPVYRPTGYGLAVIVALSVPGGMKFVSHCAKAYDLLRRVYLKNPENPSIELSRFRLLLGLDESLFAQVLCMLNDISICGASTGGAEPLIYIFPSIRDQADIWVLFELIMQGFSKPLFPPNGTAPFSTLSAAFNPPDVAHSVIGMCPEALEDWQKAHERLMRDPAGAITSARSMLESAIKWIHHQKQAEEPSKDASTGRRLKDCLKLLGGADNDFDKPGISRMVSGMETAVNGLDATRNAMSDGHGKSPDAPPANPRIARMVVGLATTLTTFLLATYESRQRP